VANDGAWSGEAGMIRHGHAPLKQTLICKKASKKL